MTNPLGRALGGLAAVAAASVALTGCTGDSILDQVISIIESVGIELPVGDAQDTGQGAIPGATDPAPADDTDTDTGDAGDGDTGDDAGETGEGADDRFITPGTDDAKPDVPPVSTEGPTGHDHSHDD